jgi:excisionase family DNA binding protein
MPQPQEKLLTVKQVAEIMSVDEKTIRSWIQRGDLRAVNIGRLRPEYRIRPADLDEFISQRQTDRSDN